MKPYSVSFESFESSYGFGRGPFNTAAPPVLLEPTSGSFRSISNQPTMAPRTACNLAAPCRYAFIARRSNTSAPRNSIFNFLNTCLAKINSVCFEAMVFSSPSAVACPKASSACSTTHSSASTFCDTRKCSARIARSLVKRARTAKVTLRNVSRSFQDFIFFSCSSCSLVIDRNRALLEASASRIVCAAFFFVSICVRAMLNGSWCPTNSDLTFESCSLATF